jgi:hypothetical protein
MTEWTSSNIEKYSIEVSEHLEKLPEEKKVKANTIKERIQILSQMLFCETKKLYEYMYQLENCSFEPERDLITRFADDCVTRGEIIRSLVKKLFEDFKVFLTDLSV